MKDCVGIFALRSSIGMAIGRSIAFKFMFLIAAWFCLSDDIEFKFTVFHRGNTVIVLGHELS